MGSLTKRHLERETRAPKSTYAISACMWLMVVAAIACETTPLPEDDSSSSGPAFADTEGSSDAASEPEGSASGGNGGEAGVSDAGIEGDALLGGADGWNSGGEGGAREDVSGSAPDVAADAGEGDRDTSETDTSTALDGGTPGDVAPPDTANGPWGRVAVLQVLTDKPYEPTALAIAHFGDASPLLDEGGGIGCTLTAGGMALDADKMSGPPAKAAALAPSLVPWLGGDWPTSPSVDAGPIQIAGTLVTLLLEYEEDEMPYYEAAYAGGGAKGLFGLPTAPISAYVGGSAAIPGFAGTTSTPDPIAILEPMLGPTHTIPLDYDLPVTWSEGIEPAERIEVRLAAVGKDGEALGGELIRCILPGSDTHVVISAQHLSSMPHSFGTNIALSVSRIRQKQVDIAGKLVIVRAQATSIGIAKAK